MIELVSGSHEIWATFTEGYLKFVLTAAFGATGVARSSQYARRSFASYSRIAEANVRNRSNSDGGVVCAYLWKTWFKEEKSNGETITLGVNIKYNPAKFQISISENSLYFD